MILHILEHSILDSLKMLPFLFAAFLIIEAVEQFSSGFLNRALAKFGKAGPVRFFGCRFQPLRGAYHYAWNTDGSLPLHLRRGDSDTSQLSGTYPGYYEDPDC